MTDAPSPLTPPDCDCTDLDGFMLNTERLMSSELVAVSSLEVIGAAVLLWARAWKQRPAASLPDDERVIAAFCKMSLARFRKVRDEVMRGFVLCSDGRWYHQFLAAEALRASERKAAYRKRREADARRLKEWRERRDRNDRETPDETRFVPEGQGRYDTGQEDELDRPSEGRRAREEKSVMVEGWKPSNRTRASLRAIGYGDDEIDWQAMRFAKHFKGQTDDDWNGRFEAWVTREPVGKYAKRGGAKPDQAPAAEPWDKRVRDYRAAIDSGKAPFWLFGNWGQPPGERGCAVPVDVLKRYGFEAAA